MEFTKKQPAFLYLDKNGFYYFETGLAQVLSLAFLATSVKDMDVINGASVMSQIKGFIDQYSLVPANITVILSPNITFEKDIVDLAHEAQEEAIKKFIETIPFDSVLSKEYPIEKGVKVIGCNEEIQMELRISFEKNAFSVDSVVPYQLMGQEQAYIRNLTLENATQLLKGVDRLRQHSMIVIEKDKSQTDQNSNDKNEQPKKKISKRLIVMAVVFIILFGILGIMIIRM